MAVGKQSDFVIYEEQFFGGVTEVLDQNANAFNGASRDTIRLITRRHRGNYRQESFIKSISGLVTRRDLTSTSSATDTAIPMDENIAVKVARKIGPIGQTLNSWRKMSQDPGLLSLMIGRQAGQAILEDYLNSGLLALEAALDNVAALEEDDTAATITTAGMVDALSKFGDRSGAIRAWVMHSKPYFDLVKEQIAANIFEVAGFVVREATPITLGRPVIVTDSPSLVETDGVSTGIDAYSTLGLVAGGLEVSESEERDLVTEVVTGSEQLFGRLQGEFSFSVACKGFKWDVANGGANPADAALGLGSNWDAAATSNKDKAGVILKTR